MKSSRPTSASVPHRATMLELVHSLAQQGISEREVVATVLALIESGRVILIGNFRGLPIRDRDEEPN
jgi:hypothetical protein